MKHNQFSTFHFLLLCWHPKRAQQHCRNAHHHASSVHPRGAFVQHISLCSNSPTFWINDCRWHKISKWSKARKEKFHLHYLKIKVCRGIFRVSQKNALSESSSCKRTPQRDHIQAWVRSAIFDPRTLACKMMILKMRFSGTTCRTRWK